MTKPVENQFFSEKALRNVHKATQSVRKFGEAIHKLKNSRVFYMPYPNKSPAFQDWLIERERKNEKLPRGKWFKKDRWVSVDVLCSQSIDLPEYTKLT